MIMTIVIIIIYLATIVSGHYRVGTSIACYGTIVWSQNQTNPILDVRLKSKTNSRFQQVRFNKF